MSCFVLTCFWFLWTGTLPLFAVVLSCFVFSENTKVRYFELLNNNTRIKNLVFSITFSAIGLFLFYGAYITYITAKTHETLQYSKIVEDRNNKKNIQSTECLPFYNEFNRGGIVLDRFLQRYSTYLFSLDLNDIEENAFFVLDQLQCKANNIILNGDANSSLLNASVQADTKFYFMFGNTDRGKNYINKNYQKWFKKTLVMADRMPQRGDLIMPFLSYAINNNKSEDAIKICEQSVKGLEAMCDLIIANKILAKEQIGNLEVKKSIALIEEAITKGLFNQTVYGFWNNKYGIHTSEFSYFGLRGIPLSPDIIFLISDKEKLSLEKLIKNNYK